MTIIHTNGSHKMSIQFCHCFQAPSNAIQLSNAQLFPSTMDHPQTAFSFAVLNHFHQSTLSLKISLFDYYDSLTKLTEPAFPQDITLLSEKSTRTTARWYFPLSQNLILQNEAVVSSCWARNLSHHFEQEGGGRHLLAISNQSK
jgi:CxC2 like cysteine cluster associated with KDZ transposases